MSDATGRSTNESVNVPIRLNSRVSELTETAMALLLPRRCPICRTTLWDRGRGWCEACERSMQLLEHPLCPNCHRFIVSTTGDCPAGHAPIAPSRIFALASFDGAFGRLVHALKYDGYRELGAHLGRLLAERLPSESPAILTSVPTSTAKRRKRGYGHAELIGEACSKAAAYPWKAGLLTFTRKVADQTRLSASQRKANMMGAFTVPGEVDLSDVDVLVIDDVYTTGATMREAGRALIAAGARSVAAAVVVVNLSKQRDPMK